MKHGTNGCYCRGCRCDECRQAHTDYQREYLRRPEANAKLRAKRAERLAWLQAIKLERGCADCGYRAHPAALEFDHLGDKRFGIARNMGRSQAAFLAEIEKCEVVCANCHAVRTAGRRAAV